MTFRIAMTPAGGPKRSSRLPRRWTFTLMGLASAASLRARADVSRRVPPEKRRSAGMAEEAPEGLGRAPRAPGGLLAAPFPVERLGGGGDGPAERAQRADRGVERGVAEAPRVRDDGARVGEDGGRVEGALGEGARGVGEGPRDAAVAPERAPAGEAAGGARMSLVEQD